ncbi:MAG: Type II secretion system protein E [Candidatus Wolfebacteria bacterium GW2011_GWE1_48_7]|uniref:Type II secretion system protein E n=2 Tax=Candidatus Wolfeibacteriota TaxID=1752735 RepID=A0A0G1X7W2_9BACT|nr:MAG: Type II secretion system protein E [Candidatus Wolfebacteria bacterium GW2011_GWB1_47_1]KKU37166.1 MAG: Type II secretion system protein E [Candidatus Wolfebacteria bacterium GW2011_GWC2_46_275]KKU42674.1 MAG: Type II secretion system protein E [Candidatus Wolfebacteria bacterium GW2011_GWB2_46_69]KKU54591.1 MAG: Type II secretion system protein E [Candidatus Wolfebacteria bacterium GW2011_GWC1_47_103]KKU59975.1 MAG: Type II secretion system protein E [Candidatus Wolfebacteria bacterium
MENKTLVDALIQDNLLGEIEGRKVLQEAALARRPVDELIYEQRLIDEEKLAMEKGKLLNVPYRKIDPQEISDETLKLFPEETVRNYKVIPVSIKDDLLIAGMVNPDNAQAQEALKFIAKQRRLNVGAYIITPSLWEMILRRYSPYRSLIDEAVRASSSISTKGAGPTQIVQLEETRAGNSDETPIIRIVSTTLKEAVWERASDIHIEPQRNRSRIRFRIDGELQEVSTLPLALHSLIVSRVKILANLKIDETRIPQDGRFRTVLFGRDIDYRVATFPTPVGEKVVIRVLDPSTGLRGLEDLGLRGRNLDTVKKGIEKPYGVILITGPTGSGKSTTLYALMQLLNKPDINIVSLEDPVEYYMDGLNQSQVKPEIGYDFASGLRQILRQDPDVIMVGEVRDEETAGLTIQAALTGHIVLSTLHTNNSVGVIPRLIDMKVQPFLLPAALNIMLAQRLVSRLCQQCKVAQPASQEIANVISHELGKLTPEARGQYAPTGPYNIYHAPGCEVCKGKGVSGRLAVFEVMTMTPELEHIINIGATESSILDEARRQGMVTMHQDGILKALEGLVSMEEVLRETVEM